MWNLNKCLTKKEGRHENLKMSGMEFKQNTKARTLNKKCSIEFSSKTSLKNIFVRSLQLEFANEYKFKPIF